MTDPDLASRAMYRVWACWHLLRVVDGICVIALGRVRIYEPIGETT
jgi:hypothetical protein